MSFTTFNGFNFGKVQTQNVSAGGGGIGGWVELGRTTLGSSGNSITVSSLADKRYYMILSYNNSTGGWSRPNLRLNSDSGSNYANRLSNNGAADVSQTSTTFNVLANGDGAPNDSFVVNYIANKSNKEKLHFGHSVTQNTVGAGTAPIRFEISGKWANTSNAISTISIINDGTHSFNTGSEVVVLGYDPSDTHTTNFWEELHSGDSGGSVASYNTGTITAKKYLWVQLMAKNVSSTQNLGLRFNSDSGNNYGFRISANGTADQINAPNDKIQFNYGDPDTYSFVNAFIVNNSANEKLVIIHTVTQGASGAGTAPSRTEWVGKWANTSSQITSIQVNSSALNLTVLKMNVWGSN